MFNQSKKITKIVTTLGEYNIWQINFFSGEELLCRVGFSDDGIKAYGWAGNVITFEIAADEQLIGATVYTGLGWSGQ